MRVHLDSERVQTLRKPMEQLVFRNYHQQYLHKNPGGYCGLGGTGCELPSRHRGLVERPHHQSRIGEVASSLVPLSGTDSAG